MHDGEIVVSAELAQRLIATQLPDWAGLPLVLMPSTGTDHTLFRLGDELLVRFPRIDWAADQAVSDQRWLPWLAPQLPLPIPCPLAVGEPAEDYPWPWSIVPWIDGEPPTPADADLEPVAAELAGFVRALAAVDPAPGPAIADGHRGARLHAIDGPTRQAVAELGDRVDSGAVLRAWDEALEAEQSPYARAWVHSDLLPGNVLVRDGRLAAVIDFGGLGVGDPATDLIPAWALFDAQSREVFRAGLGYDDGAWVRGRGWALSLALFALPYYWDMSPAMARLSLRIIDESCGLTQGR